MHSQIVCRGCRTLLLYPAGAANVQCVACSTVTPVYPQGAGMDRIVCGRCRTPLMYNRGATSVRCACCHAVTPVTRENSTSLVNCGHCRITLMFPRGARSVRCSRCDFVTNITSSAGSIPIAGPRSAENAQASTQANSMTVVVENPMTLNEKGKLVSNVAVGIASDQTAVIDPNRSHAQFIVTAPRLLGTSAVRTLGLRLSNLCSKHLH